MVKLIRDKRTGTYYTMDLHYMIEKGSVGWNVNEWDERGWYKYSFSCDTLNEVKESLQQMKMAATSDPRLFRESQYGREPEEVSTWTRE